MILIQAIFHFDFLCTIEIAMNLEKGTGILSKEGRAIIGRLCNGSSGRMIGTDRRDLPGQGPGGNDSAERKGLLTALLSM